MCNTPITLTGGIQVACRGCNRCRDNRVKDWVGRCIAETKTSVAAHAVTLTYGRDGKNRERHERTCVLTYSDVQKYFKRLRKAGYPVRYLLTGEYGKKKGRTHWHMILFWQEKVPPHKIMERCWDNFWTHGHQWWQEISPSSVRSVCKYIQKDSADPSSQSKLVMSKEPAICGHYFRQLAKRYVEQGIAPQGPFYRFPECKKKDGKPVEFYMSGVTSDQFRQAYVTAFHERFPGEHLKPSPYIEEWLDSQVEDWRVSEKIAKLEAAQKEREALKLSDERIRFREEHHYYHFGTNDRGLYDIEWRPEDEQKEQEWAEQYAREILGDLDGSTPLEWEWHYEALDKRLRDAEI